MKQSFDLADPGLDLELTRELTEDIACALWHRFTGGGTVNSLAMMIALVRVMVRLVIYPACQEGADEAQAIATLVRVLRKEMKLARAAVVGGCA